MKVIVHIGMTKSGSTALQHGLSANRKALLAAGYYYPFSEYNSIKHELLGAAIANTLSTRNLLVRKFKGNKEGVKSKAESWINNVCKQINRHKPHTLILSDESMFGALAREGAAQELASLLKGISNDIHIVAYLRSPSAHYLSSSQQRLKAAYNLRPPRPVAYRNTIESCARNITGIISLYAYSRKNWPSQDINEHFASEFLNGFSLKTKESADKNTTISAEGMSILADYRKSFHKNSNDVFTKDTGVLLKALTEVEHKVGAGRPRLHESLKDAVDHCSVDLLWLRDAYSIVFENINYDLISPRDIGFKPHRVEDICTVNEKLRARLALHALHIFTKRSSWLVTLQDSSMSQIAALLERTRTLRERLSRSLNLRRTKLLGAKHK
jgi:hypothetical protein